MRFVLTDGQQVIGELLDENETELQVKTTLGTLTLEREFVQSQNRLEQPELCPIGTMRRKLNSVFIKTEPDVWRLLYRAPDEHPVPEITDHYMDDTTVIDSDIQSVLADKPAEPKLELE